MTKVKTGQRLLSLIVVSLSVGVAVAATPTVPSESDALGILASYIKIQESLARDSLDGVAESAKKIVQTVQTPNSSIAASDKDTITHAALDMAKSDQISVVRSKFGELSGPITRWVTAQHPKDLEIVSCPMKKKSWVQKAGEIMNPYFGKEMQSCGVKKS